jgi:hypothetical protein
MALNLLPLCQSVRPASRDGYGGANAHIYAPFYGYFYFDGGQLAFPNGTVAQAVNHTIAGTYKDLPFHKAAGVCINPNPGASY